ncbi:MAG TPA: PEP-CTERM sorting domain-containing protein [Fimbriimonadaceae bacterium]|nr:PEP-CTERM sorting domain-containing protein [Fimbriimonadaceae bacterium]
MKRTLLLALGLGVCGYASASSLFVSGFISGENRFVLTTFTGGDPLQNTQAGPMAAMLDGTFGFDAYCVDSGHSPLFGSAYNVNMVTLPDAGLPNSGRIAYMYQTFAPTVTNQDQGAGLQLAIWDVLVDGGDGLTNGNFKASSVTTTMTAAANYLSQSVGHTGTATWYQGLPRGNGQPQDLIGGTPVPEPASLLVLGGAAAFFLRKRKRA